MQHRTIEHGCKLTEGGTNILVNGPEKVEFPVSDVWPDTVNIIKNL